VPASERQLVDLHGRHASSLIGRVVVMALSWASAVVAQRRASRGEVRQYFADVHDSLCTTARADRVIQPAFVDV
jgi:hypothetical protein